MTIYKCPFANRVSLQCDIMYSLDEFYRQVSQAMKQDKLIIFAIGGVGSEFECKNDPELCPRYIRHLIKNITVYKQTQR